MRKVASVLLGTLEEGRMKEGTVRSVHSPKGNMNGDGVRGRERREKEKKNGLS